MRNQLRTIKAVYSYYFPEARKVIDSVTREYPHQIFLQSIKPGLDNFDEKIINKIIKKYNKYQKGLGDFNYRYTTNGSSEGIFHLLSYIRTYYKDTPVYVLKGEYEGYKEYAKNLKTSIQEVNFDEKEIKELPLGFWFISNPSGRDGNIISNKIITDICNLGHKVIYDLAYLGLTYPYKIDLTHPNIFAVVTSFSKTLGLFYYRIGFTFTREQVKTLYPNIWFKNIFSLIIVDKILSKYNADYFYNKYKSVQIKALRIINKETKIKLNASDAILLSNLKTEDAELLSKKQKEAIQKYKRGNLYRFCLTPYFLEIENKKRAIY